VDFYDGGFVEYPLLFDCCTRAPINVLSSRGYISTNTSITYSKDHASICIINNAKGSVEKSNYTRLDYQVLSSPPYIVPVRVHFDTKEFSSFTTLRFGSCLTMNELNIVSSAECSIGYPAPPGFELEILCNVFVPNFVLSNHLGCQ